MLLQGITDSSYPARRKTLTQFGVLSKTLNKVYHGFAIACTTNGIPEVYSTLHCLY